MGLLLLLLILSFPEDKFSYFWNPWHFFLVFSIFTLLFPQIFFYWYSRDSSSGLFGVFGGGLFDLKRKHSTDFISFIFFNLSFLFFFRCNNIALFLLFSPCKTSCVVKRKFDWDVKILSWFNDFDLAIIKIAARSTAKDCCILFFCKLLIHDYDSFWIVFMLLIATLSFLRAS